MGNHGLGGDDLFGTQLLSAGNKPRLVVDWKPHGLRFVELRVLERRQSDQAVAQAGRQRLFGDIDRLG